MLLKTQFLIVISVSNYSFRMDGILKSMRGENLFLGFMHTYYLGGLGINDTYHFLE